MTPSRRWVGAGLCALAVFGAGCNPLMLPFFLFAPEPKVPPLMQRLASDDKPVTVVILASAGLETRTELVRADRDLVAFLTHHLREGCKYNKERVKVVSPTKVENFKSEHPDWQKWDLKDVGEHFEADWVVFLEINTLTLYEKGSNNMLYRGRAEINVSLVNVNDPESSPQPKMFTGQYPGEAKMAVDVSDTNPLEFRRAFLDYMAEQISWYFTAHPTNREYTCR